MHSLIIIYLLCAVSIVCDDYFIESLNKLCKDLNLKEDVAGATFMAAGTSAPELFTSIIGKLDMISFFYIVAEIAQLGER